ncbi:MAG: hypothetical protein NTW31_09435 [Bacteroidetes bacterium]|nr:hypothetical protein [Bacteroidota bacterium]
MWNFLVRFILRNRIVILFAIALITAFMAYKALDVQIQYKSQSILPDTDTTFRVYQKFIKQFGEDGSVMFIGMVEPELFKLENYNSVYDLSDSLSRIKGVEGIVSVTRIFNLVKNDSLRKFVFVPISPKKPASQAELDSIHQLILSLPFYEHLLYNRATSAYLFALTLDKNLIHSKSRLKLVNNIKGIVDRFGKRSNIEVHYSGLPYIQTLIAKKLQDEMKLFVILTLLIAAFFLFIFFHDCSYQHYGCVCPFTYTGAHYLQLPSTAGKQACKTPGGQPCKKDHRQSRFLGDPLPQPDLYRDGSMCGDRDCRGQPPSYIGNNC